MLPATLVGVEGSGLRIALEALNTARLSVGGRPPDWRKGRLIMPWPMSSSGGNCPTHCRFSRHPVLLADLATRLEAARALTYKAAALMDRQQPDAIQYAAMAKCFGSDMAMWVTTEAVQLLGGHGYTRAHPLERMMRDAKQLQILDGTNQIQRLVIARALVRD